MFSGSKTQGAEIGSLFSLLFAVPLPTAQSARKSLFIFCYLPYNLHSMRRRLQELSSRPHIVAGGLQRSHQSIFTVHIHRRHTVYGDMYILRYCISGSIGTWNLYAQATVETTARSHRVLITCEAIANTAVWRVVLFSLPLCLSNAILRIKNSDHTRGDTKNEKYRILR